MGGRCLEEHLYSQAQRGWHLPEVTQHASGTLCPGYLPFWAAGKNLGCPGLHPALLLSPYMWWDLKDGEFGAGKDVVQVWSLGAWHLRAVGLTFHNREA